MEKIVDIKSIKKLSEKIRKEKKTIVFTNGCFDILHAGHVEYLKKSSEFGDVLVLGLNSDYSVRMIKGEKRPVICQEQRALVISSLSCVDYVVLFDEPDPENLIKTVKPDILVKGADWSEDQIIGADFVKAEGGRIKRIEFEHKISTTQIIKKIGKIYYGNR